MNEVGMVVCCSHTGWRTAREVIDLSSAPVIFSHSNAFALTAHPRNLPDDLIRACAARGGVIGINGVSLLLGADGGDTEAERAMARHVDHLVQLVGPAHVGLGLDYAFDHQEITDYLVRLAHTYPAELGYTVGMHMLAPESIPRVVDELLRLGYGQEVIAGFLGGNWLRVAEQVWKPARS
jgi:membrane dipeptidase